MATSARESSPGPAMRVRILRLVKRLLRVGHSNNRYPSGGGRNGVQAAQAETEAVMRSAHVTN